MSGCGMTTPNTDTKFLQHEKATQIPRNRSALYQQRPAPETGDYFKAEWLRSCNQLPPRETLRVYGASDYAVTASGGDYTVHVVLGVDPEDTIYVLDIWRKQSAELVILGRPERLSHRP